MSCPFSLPKNIPIETIRSSAPATVEGVILPIRKTLGQVGRLDEASVYAGFGVQGVKYHVGQGGYRLHIAHKQIILFLDLSPE